MKTSHRHLVGFVVVAALFLLAYLIAQREDTRSAAPPPVSANIPLAEATGSPPTEVSATNLRAALTEVCSTGDTEAADKEWTQEEIRAQIDAFNELKLDLSDSLSVSASAEDLHLAAMLGNDSVARVKLLEQAISISPYDPFLVWSAVRICSDSAAFLDCPLGDWEQRLTAVDGQNSESWIRIAANRYALGETDAALEAMRNAATAAETRIYWTETVEMIERGLAAAGSDHSFPERAGMAFGFAAMMLPVYSDYTRMCAQQSPLSAEWAYTCLGYGELAENRGKTEIGVSIGRSIQKLALEALGETDKAADIEHRLQRRRQERLGAGIDHAQKIARLLVANPTIFSAFLASTRSMGEEAARRKITADIERLIEQHPDLACGD